MATNPITDQISMFDLSGGDEVLESASRLSVVNADFIDSSKMTWRELFEDYDELYAITYSSGIAFSGRLLSMFKYAEIIYGCEEILSSSVAAVMAVERAMVETLTKSEYAAEMAERIEIGTLKLFVSRDLKSHEKIFCLKSDDGRKRVITGSANMSASAFEGLQRENIVCFDGDKAYDWYMSKYNEFRKKCADSINHKVFASVVEQPDYLGEHPETLPIMNTIEKEKVIYLEAPDMPDELEEELVTKVRGLEAELKPILPKAKKDDGKLLISSEDIRMVRSRIRDGFEQKKVREKHFPKLHIDFGNETMTFNGNVMNLNPSKSDIVSDIVNLSAFMSSLEAFHGDYREAQRDYFRFLNWYFASVFMPYLRYVASYNSYDMIPFPVTGIMYGDSNGGKTTFIKLLMKMMTGKKIPLNTTSDFTATEIEKLRRGIEGVPINVDDLDRNQFRQHADKIIKDDEWGIRDRFINYPAVAITTNKLPSLEAPISKRVVGIRIDIRIGKEEGVKNAKRLNESMKNISTSFFCEYVRCMLPKVYEMEEMMKQGDDEYFPDIFRMSSDTIKNIFDKYSDVTPEYIVELDYADYFGEKVLGRKAIQRIVSAWDAEPGAFEIDRKKNRLTYEYPETANMYELRYIADELPPQLEAQVLSRTLSMKLDEAEIFFDTKFKKGLFGRR